MFRFVMPAVLLLMTLVILAGCSSDDAPTAPDATYPLTAYPAPFTSCVTLTFSVSEPGNVNMTIHDESGAQVRHLVSGVLNVGTHYIVWRGEDDNGVEVVPACTSCG